MFNLDAVICISLKESAARREHIERQFRPLFPELTYFLAERDQENPERGCFNSHRQVAIDSLSRNYSTVLILEDDAQLDFCLSRRATKRISDFVSHEKFDIFYFGGIVGKISPINSLCVAACKLFCTHAYIIAESGMTKLTKTTYLGRPLDVLYHAEFQSYCSLPLFVSQLPEEVAPSSLRSYSAFKTTFDRKFWVRNRFAAYKSWIRGLVLNQAKLD